MNKYQCRTIKEESPPEHTTILIKSSLKDPRECAVKLYLDYDGHWREFCKGTPDNDPIVGEHVLWRPLKQKLNKYRWREMKYEKPEIGEIIYLYMKTKPGRKNTGHGYVMFDGIVENSVPERFRAVSPIGCQHCNEMSLPIDSNSFLWRKMCKLPGEK